MYICKDDLVMHIRTMKTKIDSLCAVATLAGAEAAKAHNLKGYCEGVIEHIEEEENDSKQE